jgi:hypothetical protein
MELSRNLVFVFCVPLIVFSATAGSGEDSDGKMLLETRHAVP